MSKAKFYQNPNRSSKIETERYVPQYQVHGINPMPVKGFGAGAYSTPVTNYDMTDFNNNPRTRSPQSRLPYATDGSVESHSDLHENFNHIPNVDSTESTWAFSRESSYDVIGGDELNLEEDTVNKSLHDIGDDEANHLQEDSYVLIFKESVVHVGSLRSTESVITEFMCGSHELCDGKKVNLDDIILLKRVKIKYGLFFEE